eukprot:9425215-Alexandrium_andersonii.AAC.1
MAAPCLESNHGKKLEALGPHRNWWHMSNDAETDGQHGDPYDPQSGEGMLFACPGMESYPPVAPSTNIMNLTTVPRWNVLRSKEALDKNTRMRLQSRILSPRQPGSEAFLNTDKPDSPPSQQPFSQRTCLPLSAQSELVARPPPLRQLKAGELQRPKLDGRLGIMRSLGLVVAAI